MWIVDDGVISVGTQEKALFFLIVRFPLYICFGLLLHYGSHVVHASEVVVEYVCVGLIPCVKNLLIDVGIIPLIIQR